ncbi:MAG: HAD-IA family hydrolase [Verrucomicrobia bacterium]|nr:HAD-IA family hydrolase [Verrucomicrobiota bacterium]
MIRALVYEFDGLILETETPLIDAYGLVHAHHDVPFDRDAFIRCVGHADYAFDPWHGFSPHSDDRGLPVCLASNSPHSWCDVHLARLGLFDRFSFLACREDAPSPKPEPDLYKLVLNRFGLRGHEAIAFEDSHTGSLAAKRANLWTVACPGPSTAHHDFAHVDLRVTSLAEVTLDGLITRFASGRTP